MSQALDLQGVIDGILSRQGGARVLEAGCGSVSELQMRDAHIVGIDISQKQLDLNSVVHEKILGDVQTYPLPESSFDLIVCWDVLEHLPRPELALENLARAARPDGVLLLAFPSVMSVKGVLAKFTPYFVHRAVYRFVYGSRLGDKGYEPFPTYLRLTMSPDAIRRWARTRGLTIECFEIYESGMQRKMRTKLRLVGPPWSLVKGAVRVLSFGRLSAEVTDCLVLLRRPVDASTPAQAAAAGSR